MRVDRAELARRALAGYPHGQAAVTEATAVALAKVPDPVAVLLVEGVSDQIAVETLAARCGHDLIGERIAVVPTGGAGGIRRALAEHATVRLSVLCDAGEAGLVQRVLNESRPDVPLLVCDPDLEAELIRAVGVDEVLAILDSQGDRGSFSTLQKQRHWCDRPADQQLRRFIGAGARRKLRYARLLTAAAVDLERVPLPLRAALDASRS